MGRGRPKGSKNRTKKIAIVDLNIRAKNFANLFIAQEHIDNAEVLAVKIVEIIRANKKSLQKKYGGKK